MIPGTGLVVARLVEVVVLEFCHSRHPWFEPHGWIFLAGATRAPTHPPEFVM